MISACDIFLLGKVAQVPPWFSGSREKISQEAGDSFANEFSKDSVEAAPDSINNMLMVR